MQNDLGTHLGGEDFDNRIVDPCMQNFKHKIIAGPVRRHLQVPLLTFEDGICEAKATAGDTHLGDEN